MRLQHHAHLRSDKDPTMTSTTQYPRRRKGTGTIYWDAKKQRWIGTITIGNSDPQKTQSATAGPRGYAEVDKALALIVRDHERGLTGGSAVTVNDAVDRWVARGIPASDAEATRVTKLWSASKIKEGLGKKRLRSLTVIDLERFLDGLAAGGLGQASLVKVRSHFHQVLKLAEKAGLVGDNVAAKASVTPDAKPAVTKVSLTLDEVPRFQAELPGSPLGAMFQIMLSVGLRPGEAAGLLWEDFDETTGALRIGHGRQVDRTGKAIVGDALKTEHSYRTVGLPALAVKAVLAHRSAQKLERMKARRWADPRLMFATSVGTPLSPSNVRRELDRLTAAAGVTQVTPNELRHTAISVMAAANTLSLHQIADACGTSVRMIEQTYRQRPQLHAGHVAIVDALFGDGPWVVPKDTAL